MIFFLSTLIPSSNVESQIKKYKETLFQKQLIIPHPLILIPAALSLKKPDRPSRRLLAQQYPEKLTFEPLSLEKEIYSYSIKETIPFSCNESLADLTPLVKNKLFIGQEYNKGFNDMPIEEFNLPSIKKYSLAVYKISTESKKNWWHNMSWELIFQVRKGK